MLEYTFEEKPGNRDLGNLEKATTDILVEHQVIEADSKRIVRKITLNWSKDIVGARVCISPAIG